jgi:hypothetical protein
MSVTHNFSGGVTGTEDYGQRWQIRVLPAWNEGDSWTLDIACPVLGDATLGVGYMGKLFSENFVSMFPYNDRVYLALGERFNYSATGNAMGWERQSNALAYKGETDMQNAGFLPFNSTGMMDRCLAFGTLQGRLVLFGENLTQVWSVPADDTEFRMEQALLNIGTIAPNSVQSLGDADVLFLTSSGVRSLRTLLLTMNATLDDVGAPLDMLLQEFVRQSPAVAEQAVGFIEPRSKQYWLCLDGNAYVLARYPQSEIVAWSSVPLAYRDHINPNLYHQVLPRKVIVIGQKTYMLSNNAMVLLGGANFDKYFGGVLIETHWTGGEEPLMRKQATSIDLSVQGKWKVYATMDYTAQSPQWTLVDEVEAPTYSPFNRRYSAVGTHIKLKFLSDPSYAGPAKLGDVSFNYQLAGMKG